MTGWARKDLLGIEELEPGEILEILDTAQTMKEISTREIKKVPALRGKTVVNLFFEASTRTRISFELAEKRLSADIVNVSTVGQQRRARARRSSTRRATSRRCGRTSSSCATAPRDAAPAGPAARRARWSTPGTAPTSTRRRRCSTRSPSASASGASRG